MLEPALIQKPRNYVTCLFLFQFLTLLITQKIEKASPAVQNPENNIKKSSKIIRDIMILNKLILPCWFIKSQPWIYLLSEWIMAIYEDTESYSEQ